MSEYIAPSKEQLFLEDFLSWCGKDHGGVIMDITKPNIENRSNYKMLSHSKLIEEYLEKIND